MNEQDILLDNIYTTVEITCTGCNSIKTDANLDDMDFSQTLIKEGWRATKSNNVYCPTCSKKKLKPKP